MHARVHFGRGLKLKERACSPKFWAHQKFEIRPSNEKKDFKLLSGTSEMGGACGRSLSALHARYAKNAQALAGSCRRGRAGDARNLVASDVATGAWHSRFLTASQNRLAPAPFAFLCSQQRKLPQLATPSADFSFRRCYRPGKMAGFASCGFGAVRAMLKRILLGQALAFLNSLTGVSTTKLVNNNASYPVLQSVTAYAFICAVYLPLFLFVLYKYRAQRFSDFTFLNRWWKYAILAVVDLEANYVVVLAYQYTNMISVQLLSCFTVPCVLVLSFFFLRMKFAITHVVGGVIAIGGLVFLIALDADGLSRSGGGSQEVLGDMLCLISSALYAASNVLTEWFVKPSKPALFFSCCARRPSDAAADDTTSALPHRASQEPAERYAGDGELDAPADLPQVPVYVPVVENLAMMSSFALVFATIQFFAAEWKTLKPNRSAWTGEDWLFQMVFGVTMLLLYTAMPVMFIISSAAFANISLLTANVYSIIWNVTIFKIYPTKLFFVSYVIIVVGILLYNLTDMVRIPFCSRWNYPCGDPFKNDVAETETDAEEQMRESAAAVQHADAEDGPYEADAAKGDTQPAKAAIDSTGQIDESRREV